MSAEAADWKRRAMQGDYDRHRSFLPPWMRAVVDARAAELGLAIISEECGLPYGVSGIGNCCLPAGHWQAHHAQSDNGGSAAWLDREQMARDAALRGVPA